jgi:hypothetical protein
VIDIGRSPVPENRIYYSNQITPESKLFFERQDNYLPAPYSGSST